LELRRNKSIVEEMAMRSHNATELAMGNHREFKHNLSNEHPKEIQTKRNSRNEENICDMRPRNSNSGTVL